jgi:hypothetical protein
MSTAARPLGFLALLLCVIAAFVPAPVAASYLTGTVTDDAGRMVSWHQSGGGRRECSGPWKTQIYGLSHR